MRRVFADSSVLIAGAGSRSGASRAVLTMAEIGLFKLVLSRQVLDECERNLGKKLPVALPVFAELLAHINPEILPDPPPEESAQWEAIIEPKDAPILATAVNTAADRLLTLDVKDFTPEVAAQSGLVIQTPGDFVQEIRGIIEKGLP
ncbi:MAG: PIN domain-containing protein [Anaerolineae bacterium]|jgi:predicted nucleic acid-binding protein